MKEIKLKQYIEVRRTVTLLVDDDCTEKEAAELLNKMPLEASELPDNAKVEFNWVYISDRDIENADGEVVLSGDE